MRNHKLISIVLASLILLGTGVALASFDVSNDTQTLNTLNQESSEIIDSIDHTFNERMTTLTKYYNDAIIDANVNDMEIESLIVEKYDAIQYLRETKEYLIELEKHKLSEYRDYWQNKDQ